LRRNYCVGLGIPLEPLQIGANVRGVLVAQAPVFLQTLVDDSFQFGWHLGIQPHRSHGRTFQNGIKDQR
jgi:hypothetical protein